MTPDPAPDDPEAFEQWPDDEEWRRQMRLIQRYEDIELSRLECEREPPF